MNRRACIVVAVMIWVICSVLFAACHGENSAKSHQEHAADSMAVMPVTECLVKTTPVKNLGASALCWVYAMLATIESEHLMQGDSVNLSPLFIGRMYLEEQAETYYLTQGKRPVTQRGMASTALHLLQRYGITHWDAFHGDVNLNVLARKVEKTAHTCMARRTGVARLRDHVSTLLDEHMHTAPQYVFMLGAEYTTREFAHSVCREHEYVALTSFTHHPFYQEFELQLPDNYYHDTFMNLPLDTLIHHIEHALRSGHPVCWEGDTSEPCYSFAQGIGKMECDNVPVTQQMRQQMFERFQTTDDHCMEIIGIARTPRGKKYFICKNSWGTGNALRGLVYLSENYLRAKTIAVWMSREAFAAGATQNKSGFASGFTEKKE